MGSITLNLLGAGARLNLQRSQQAVQTAFERLATGSRINRASDDPSGLVAAESMSAERASLERRIERYERANLRLAAEEGVLGVVGDLLVELDGLVVTASNTDGLSGAERKALQVQADSILDAIGHIRATATYDGQLLLGGAGGRVVVQGAPGPGGGSPGDDQPLSLASIRSGGRLNLVDGDLEAAQEFVRAARDANTERRAGIGRSMNDNDRRHRLAGVELENLTGAISMIKDTDYAAEVSALVRAQVLEQASMAVISLGARQTAASVLSLLPR